MPFGPILVQRALSMLHQLVINAIYDATMINKPDGS